MGLFDHPPAQPRRPRVYTVSDLTREITALLEQHFPAVAVAGETSNVRQPASGHIYFTLKDENSQISAVMWRSLALSLPFALKDGMAVTLFGEVSVYGPRGAYQIVVRRVEPQGVGALELAYRQLCAKLKEEGLFDEQHKKPIPALPRTVGVVTSATGAALRDILRTIDATHPALHVLLRPAPVQGEAAAARIAEAIEDLNRCEVDVIIVGRGGGSLEDLWAFNEELVARAIFASHVPVISAVGHEIDLTISDLVADERQPTPTSAGERVTREWVRVRDRLDRASDRLVQTLATATGTARETLRRLAGSFAFRQPFEFIRRREQRLDEIVQRLVLAERALLRHADQRTRAAAGRLEALNPLRVLARGYSITMSEDGRRPLRDASSLAAGDRVRTRLHDGEFTSIVEA